MESHDSDVDLPGDCESEQLEPPSSDDGISLPDEHMHTGSPPSPNTSTASSLELPSAPSQESSEEEGHVIRHSVVEMYSPPRVVPAAVGRGHCASISADLETGFDFLKDYAVQWSVKLLSEQEVEMLVLSPPCTMFSALQTMWNFKRMDPVEVSRRWTDACALLAHSMRCAAIQVRRGKRFVFEHPASASSWKEECVCAVQRMDNVQCVVFDQCMMGLKSKVSQTPMRKRTRLLTNCDKVVSRFSGLLCKGEHEHVVIEGVEGGEKRSLYAQRYPREMVDAIVDCI